MGEEQLWLKDGWYAKFNRAPDPRDIGWGHTPEEVSSFRSPDVATLLGPSGVSFPPPQHHPQLQFCNCILHGQGEKSTAVTC